MADFRYKNLDEYIEKELTLEEREKFKDLIKESKTRQAETKKNIESLETNWGKLEKSLAGLTGAYKTLLKITEEAEKGIEKLKKIKENLEYQNQILSAYKERKNKYMN